MLLIAALAFIPEPVPSEMTSIGIGGEACRSWTINRQISTEDREADKQWLAGFLTGIEFSGRGLGAQPLLRKSDDPTAFIGVADDFCAQNPLKTVAEAAQAVWLELFRRSQP